MLHRVLDSSLLFLLAGAAVYGQFKEVGAAPFPPAEAHQKIRSLLDDVNPSNRQQTAKTLVGWLVWYRDIADQEMIAEWRSDKRAGLGLVVDELGDARVGSEIAASWRQPGLSLLDAPMLEKLFTHFSDGAEIFVRDLLRNPDLSGNEAEAACRILIDLPERWRNSALQILPHYRNSAQPLLTQDLRTGDEDKMGRAQFFLRDLGWEVPGETNRPQPVRRRAAPAPATSTGSLPPRPRLSGPVESESIPSSQPEAVTLRPVQQPQARVSGAYNGAQSGTLSCIGTIPQNAEYVFRDLPPVPIRLDYDEKAWNARLAPGDVQTQRVILRNISSGPRKGCVVHWNVIQQ